MFSEVPGPQQGVSFLLGWPLATRNLCPSCLPAQKGVPESGGSRPCSEALGHQLHRVAQGWV